VCAKLNYPLKSFTVLGEDYDICSHIVSSGPQSVRRDAITCMVHRYLGCIFTPLGLELEEVIIANPEQNNLLKENFKII
jgi:hypothetical protein